MQPPSSGTAVGFAPFFQQLPRKYAESRVLPRYFSAVSPHIVVSFLKLAEPESQTTILLVASVRFTYAWSDDYYNPTTSATPKFEPLLVLAFYFIFDWKVSHSAVVFNQVRYVGSRGSRERRTGWRAKCFQHSL